MNEEFQLKLQEKFQKYYNEEFNSLPLYSHGKLMLGYYIYNPHFGSVDGENYYCMICHFKPNRIIEVGAEQQRLSPRPRHILAAEYEGLDSQGAQLK
jgi:C4-type Zn-finger protein